MTAVDLPVWYRSALCAETDPELFYPDKGGTARPAMNICADCPVRLQCLAWALDTREPFGIWGGTTERERRKLRRAAA